MQPKFSADEKVLCYHGPLLYEAKILKHKKEGGTYSYFVHYQVRSFIESIVEKMFSSIFYCQGWNKNWDEWVPETRIMKQVAENFDKQKKLLATHMAQNKAKKQKLKTEKAVKKSKGGSDSGSNSRASTPVGDSRQSAALGSSSTGGGSGASGGGGAGTPGGRQQPGSKRSGGAAPAQDPDTDPVAATPTVSTPAATARDSEPETSTPASTAASTPAQVTKETGASTRKKAKKEETVEESAESILSGENTIIFVF